MSNIPDDIRRTVGLTLTWLTDGTLTIEQVRNLAPVLEEDILAERERCARIAEGRDPGNPFAPLDTQEGWLRQRIAADIRKGGE